MSDAYQELKRKHVCTLGDSSPRSDVPRGWAKIVDDALTQVEEIAAKKGLVPPEILQVKEKMAELIFHRSKENEDPEITEVFRKAAIQAASTCQICGSPGADKNINWWLYIVCDACAEAIAQKGFRKALEERAQVVTR